MLKHLSIGASVIAVAAMVSALPASAGKFSDGRYYDAKRGKVVNSRRSAKRAHRRRHANRGDVVTSRRITRRGNGSRVVTTTRVYRPNRHVTKRIVTERRIYGSPRRHAYGWRDTPRFLPRHIPTYGRWYGRSRLTAWAVRNDLKDRGYRRIRITDNQLPRYEFRACRNGKRFIISTNRFGDVRWREKIGYCGRGRFYRSRYWD